MQALLDIIATFPEIGPARAVPPSGDWFYAQVPGEQAIALWEALREQIVPLGYWPLILGRRSDSLTSPGRTDSWPIVASHEEIANAASSLDLEGWLGRQLGGRTGHSGGLDGLDGFDGFFTPEAMQPNHQFSVHLNQLTHKPYSEVGMALIPLPHGWLVPAFFHIGGWNACPSPEVHVRLLETWARDYGAELVGYCGDVLELRVLNPPRSLEQARELARAQYAYCPDIVEQGVQTIENLARTLVDSSVWYFWWD